MGTCQVGRACVWRRSNSTVSAGTSVRRVERGHAAGARARRAARCEYHQPCARPPEPPEPRERAPALLNKRAARRSNVRPVPRSRGHRHRRRIGARRSRAARSVQASGRHHLRGTPGLSGGAPGDLRPPIAFWSSTPCFRPLRSCPACTSSYARARAQRVRVIHLRVLGHHHTTIPPATFIFPLPSVDMGKLVRHLEIRRF